MSTVTQKYLKDESGNMFSPITSINSIYTGDGKSLLDFFYPVGSYYETSDSNFDPNVSWGGTWKEDSGGYVMVSRNSGTFATVGGNVGSETKTLSVANLPSHTHTFTGSSHTHSVGAHSHGLNSHTHTYNKSATTSGSTALTVDQIPSHAHNIGRSGIYNNAGYGGFSQSSGTAENFTTGSTGGGKGHTHSITLSSTNSGAASGSTANSSAFNTGSTTQGGTIGNTGSGSAVSIIQPSKVCIRWHRTA